LAGVGGDRVAVGVARTPVTDLDQQRRGADHRVLAAKDGTEDWFLHPCYTAVILQKQGVPFPLYAEGGKALTAGLGKGGFMQVTGMAIVHATRDILDPGYSWTWTAGRNPDDRTEIARASITITGNNPQMYMDPRPTLDVSLSDSEMPVLMDGLRAMFSAVRRVRTRFADLF
jgi:hypothetical protein